MEFVAIPYTDPFKMATTVVTQDKWKSVMGTEPWKAKLKVNEGDDYPAVCVSWNDAVVFCKKLSEKLGKTCRLPTEAEWEFACRGGSTTRYHFGDDEGKLKDYAWFYGNCQDEQYAHRVAQKLPNQYDLYDMHGNVWEWCSDDFGDDECNIDKVVKGGSWYYDATHAQSAFSQCGFDPDYHYFFIGFRVLMEI